MGIDVAAPTPRDYSQETRDTLQAQIDLAPQKFAAEQKYAPQYADLQLGMLKSAAPQIADIYAQTAPKLAQASVGANSVQRAGDINDIATLGPQARAALRASSPDQARLLDSITSQAQAGLDAGSQLTPEQARLAQQQSRQALSDRGLATGPNAALDEAVRQQMMGAGVQQQRQQSGLQALGANQQFYGDPFSQILGRSGQGFGATAGALGQAQGTNPGALFNPESQYSADINNQNWQGVLASRTASAANTASLAGAGLSAL